jgi:Spy/CpxP family protein refolding chaperone
MKYWISTMLLLMSSVATAQSPPTGATDDIAQNLFAPELVFKYRDAIGLDGAQSKSLKDLVQKAQGRFLDLQWDMQGETGKLAQLLRLPKVDEAGALAQVDKVLGMEREVKRAQISLLIEIKNLLTPVQQQKLFDLRGKTP